MRKILLLLFLFIPILVFAGNVTIQNSTDIIWSNVTDNLTAEINTSVYFTKDQVNSTIDNNANVTNGTTAYGWGDHSIVGYGTSNLTVNDTVYGAGWNGSTAEVPSQNAVYDKIETVIAGGGEATTVLNTETINMTLAGTDVSANLNTTVNAPFASANKTQYDTAFNNFFNKSSTFMTNWNTSYNNYANKSTFVNTTYPITGGANLSADRTIAMNRSSATLDGYLNATVDFAHFNESYNNYLNKSNETLYLQNGSTGSGLTAINAANVSGQLNNSGAGLTALNGKNLTDYSVETVDINNTSSIRFGTLGFVFDGNNATVAVGVGNRYRNVPYNCTILSTKIWAGASGNATVAVWCNATAFPTVTDIISSSAPITLSSATNAYNSTLTGWTKTLVNGSWLAFNVTSVDQNWTATVLNVRKDQ